MARKLVWDLASINVHLDEIRDYWAQSFGITGAQWRILMALADLDCGEGVSVKQVGEHLHVHSSFITLQCKTLMKNGLLRRGGSKHDARVVLMSLSDKAARELADLSVKQELLDKFIFAEFEARTLKEIGEQIEVLKDRLQKATLRLAADVYAVP